MSSFARSNSSVSQVTVEYDKNGARCSKEFKDVFSARRFYAAKYKEGKNPKIINASR